MLPDYQPAQQYFDCAFFPNLMKTKTKKKVLTQNWRVFSAKFQVNTYKVSVECSANFDPNYLGGEKQIQIRIRFFEKNWIRKENTDIWFRSLRIRCHFRYLMKLIFPLWNGSVMFEMTLPSNDEAERSFFFCTCLRKYHNFDFFTF